MFIKATLGYLQDSMQTQSSFCHNKLSIPTPVPVNDVNVLPTSDNNYDVIILKVSMNLQSLIHFIVDNFTI